jgi:ATP-binding cassette subfamily B protein
MDCGPAALTCLLEGFGMHASYGRLREACQTDVDGTSIDTIEEVATTLGFDAEQMMVPLDFLLRPESAVLPAIVVVRLPGGLTHFVVAWRRHGGLLQVMDPAMGRRWISGQRFLESVYVHTAHVPTTAWREWAASDPVLAVMRASLARAGIDADPFVFRALEHTGWQGLAALDAGCRAITALLRAGALRRGREATRALEQLTRDPGLIGRQYWSVETAGQHEVAMQGAVLIHASGLRTETPEERRLSPELSAALSEPPTRPARELWQHVRTDGLFAPAIAVAGLVLAAAGVILEAVLLRALVDLGRDLPLAGQRTGALAALIALLVSLLWLDMRVATVVARVGRQLEIRLRVAFLRKIPRLADRYFQSRLKSDMAERSHVSHRVRAVPDLAARLVRSSAELTFTCAAIAWVDPTAAPLAACAALAAVGLPLAAQPVITERDLRVRTHSGALCRFYLDALLGLAPIRTHGADRAIRREHGRFLADWARAGLDLQRTAVRVEMLQLMLAFGLAAWGMLGHIARTADAGSVLLLVYWFLSLPMIGEEIALIAWQYPAFRNTTLRVLEPLGALENSPTNGNSPLPSESRRAGVAISFDRMTVRASGHAILNEVTLDVQAGSHVAIVGPSGAGKSSLVGVLLGWHRPGEGAVVVDGVPLNECLEALRAQTAWVDPAVQLWNRSMTDNLLFGSNHDIGALPRVVDAAALWNVLQKMPEGMDTPLGEGGALLSGGEGQRVRLARAMLRADARLVILDEPFRGLDRSDRRLLLGRARDLWQRATLLCITHDVAHTTDFDRVLVLERGLVSEDGSPECLAGRPGSRYRAMLDEAAEARRVLWEGDAWRQARLDGGQIRFRDAEEVPA